MTGENSQFTPVGLREEIRVRCYQMATVLGPRLLHSSVHVDEVVNEAAERFAEFVGHEKWKFRALEMAVAEKRHETTLDYCIASATKAVLFAKIPEKVEPQPQRETKRSSKKIRTRKR